MIGILPMYRPLRRNLEATVKEPVFQPFGA